MQKCTSCTDCVTETQGQLREYRICYSNQNFPSPQVFTRLHQRLIKSGCVQKQRNEVFSALDFYVDDEILLRVEEGPVNSSRKLALEIGVS